MDIKQVLFIWVVLTGVCTYEAFGADLDRLTFEVSRIHNNRDPYIPQYSVLGGLPDRHEYWKTYTGVAFDTTLVRLEKAQWYWDNEIYGKATNRQYRHVGWKFESGVNWGDSLEFFWNHHSQHVLEDVNTDSKYPVSDRYGVRIIFYP